ncbi:MAG: cytochrome C, partial [Gammaproteobacteria bacterium]|nr:cytochrome C [Gammaproteobacteria bacterium]
MTIALLCTQQATAQIETLVMPGKVIEGHADVETDCDSCHQKFERQRQRVLCLVCHEDVGADIESQLGFHGRFESARDDRCASCHTDHEGREADIVNLDEQTFDHDFTDFSLQGGHAEVECTSCHAPDTRYREAPSDCYSCHEADNIHDPGLGTECAACHKPS